MKVRLLTALLFLSLPILAQPSIDVVNNVPSIFNVSGVQTTLAPNVVFVVYGKNLGPASIVIAPPPNYPAQLAGSSISFTPAAGGAAIAALMYYSLSNAVTGVLPSSTAPGNYAVRVTYNGQTSPPQTVTVVARSFNIATANGAGTGIAQATIAQVNAGFSLTRYSTVTAPAGSFAFSPAHPNDSISLWGTGGGSDPANDAGGSSGDQSVAGNFKVNIGGRTVTPIFAGAVSGYPGLWVVIFNVPADITPDCYAIAQVSSNGALSNAAIVPIAAAGQSVCPDPSVTPAILSKLDSGGTIVGATFGAFRQTDVPTGTVIEGSNGAIFKWTAAEWAAGGPARGNPAGCTVHDRTVPRNAADPASPDTALDAGASIPFAGPKIAAAAALARTSVPLGPNRVSSPIYQFSTASGTFAAGGNYTLTAKGGADVGAFTVSSTFPTNFTVTNFDALTSVNRAVPLVINWTGTGIDQVTIQLNTTTSIGQLNHIVTVFCIAPAAPGTFTVPVGAMAQLQPAAATGSSFGGIAITGSPNASTFSAPLTAGGQVDFGVFTAELEVTKNIAVQ